MGLGWLGLLLLVGCRGLPGVALVLPYALKVQEGEARGVVAGMGSPGGLKPYRTFNRGGEGLWGSG
ncbi:MULTISPECIES: hypothetical protein [Thermus]|uniref:hypothetical protein n=1 Tax=Thermus TaxID=270 RepID=UPI001FAB1A97|nr:hypothetical protein [Thermus neutrinimicus]